VRQRLGAGAIPLAAALLLAPLLRRALVRGRVHFRVLAATGGR
jgi:hypothetical protein